MTQTWYDASQSREDPNFRPMNRQNRTYNLPPATYNIFPRPTQQQDGQLNQSGNSYGLVYLSNLCNDLIKVRENYGNPTKYAHFIISSILDNVAVDLCQILPRYDKEHEELTHKIGCLLGYDSPAFKLIFSDADLFDYFLELFTRHAELSNANFGTAQSSLYIWLLNGYLQRLLPTSDIELSTVQASFLFQQQNKKPAKAISKTTPFQLLREDLFLNASDSSFENIFDHSTYAKLFQFVELLISNYTNTSISPSPTQIVSLKAVVENYTEFLLTSTFDNELKAFKDRLRSNRQFAQLISTYLKTMLSNNAINIAFVYHFEILITLLCPGDVVFVDAEKASMFKRFSTARFLDLLDILLDRLTNADTKTLLRLDLLQFYLVMLMNNNFIRLLCDLRVSAINYLKPLQERLKASIDSDPNSSTFSRFSSFMNDNSNDEKEIKTYLAIINERMHSQFVTYPPSDPTERPIEEESVFGLGNITVGAMNSTLNRKPKTGLPDFYVDSWNSMYHLTPRGIEQVLSKQARFDFSQYGKKIYRTQGKCKWENEWLAGKLNKVALSLTNHPFVRYLRRASNNKAVGPILRPFMMPRSPANNVPVYGKKIPRHLETLNLRIFASYPVIIVLLYFAWKFVCYLLGFIF